MKYLISFCFCLLFSVNAFAFSFDDVVIEAENLSKSEYKKVVKELPENLKNMDYDAHRLIRYIREKGPWYNQKLPFEVQFFHLGSLFKNSVEIMEVDGDKVNPFVYNSLAFKQGDNDLYPFSDLGYAGFRIHNPLNTNDYFDELISFLGASYFRALGKSQKYGLSARGLAVDTAVMSGEEFPEFIKFWLVKPVKDSKSLIIYALLDSPRITGAYAFDIKPGDTTSMNVKVKLFPRDKIEKVGIAPLTSMFLFGENTKNRFFDYRMEVHDSDGILIKNSSGEWLWRPLDNNLKLRVSDFSDVDVKGFGLLQRDVNPNNYMDFEAFYHERPSVWVEPVKPFGEGVVELVEIPSDKEIHDNIVAMFIPKDKLQPGQKYEFEYNLYWFKNSKPFNSNLAEVVATYSGVGGVSGVEEKDFTKFVIDFKGDNLKNLKIDDLKADVSVSNGEVKNVVVIYNPLTKGYRIIFDFKCKDSVSELRAVLKKDGINQSEVWSYQWLK